MTTPAPAPGAGVDRNTSLVPLDGAPPQADRHSGWTIALHWASAAALLLGVAAALLRDATEHDPTRVLLMEAHRQLGLLVLLLLVPRLVARFTLGLRDFTEDSPALVRLAIYAGHMTIYVMVLLVPLLGWACSSAHGVGLRLLGFVPLPALVVEDADLADQLSDWHTWAGWTMLAVLAGHAAAACWHHWVRRDGVLSAMLPLLRRRERDEGPGAAR